MLLALEMAPAYSKIINRLYRQAAGGGVDIWCLGEENYLTYIC